MRECIRCGNFTDSLICKCVSEKLSKDIQKIQDTFRKKNEILIFSIPHQNIDDRLGKSNFSANIIKKRRDNGD